MLSTKIKGGGGQVQAVHFLRVNNLPLFSCEQSNPNPKGSPSSHPGNKRCMVIASSPVNQYNRPHIATLQLLKFITFDHTRVAKVCHFQSVCLSPTTYVGQQSWF